MRREGGGGGGREGRREEGLERKEGGLGMFRKPDAIVVRKLCSGAVYTRDIECFLLCSNCCSPPLLVHVF